MRLRPERKEKPATTSRPDETPQTSEAHGPRYARPRVLLVDLPESEVQLVRDAGFNVVQGTLGKPLSVKATGGFGYVPLRAKLPGFAEQEIIVVDLATPDPVDEAPESPPPGEPHVWQKLSSGVVDPRPLAAHYVSDK